jgi:hypothetical protein
MITPESLEPGAEKKMVGSFMLFEAESVEEVKKILEKDPYYAANVVSNLCLNGYSVNLTCDWPVGQRKISDLSIHGCQPRKFEKSIRWNHIRAVLV